MAILCTHCGKLLPKDDARFCQHCGMLVPSHPFSAQSLGTVKDSSEPSSAQPELKKTGLREQIAEQPASPSIQEEPPAWMSRLGRSDRGTSMSGIGDVVRQDARGAMKSAGQSERGSTSSQPGNTPGVPKSDQQSSMLGGWPEPITYSHVPPAQPSTSRNSVSEFAQEDFPTVAPVSPNSAQQDLRVKGGDQEKPLTPDAMKQPSTLPVAMVKPDVVSGHGERTLAEVHAVDDLPTRPVIAMSAGVQSAWQEAPQPDEHVEYLSTMPLAAQVQPKNPAPSTSNPNYMVVRESTPAPQSERKQQPSEFAQAQRPPVQGPPGMSGPGVASQGPPGMSGFSQGQMSPGIAPMQAMPSQGQVSMPGFAAGPGVASQGPPSMSGFSQGPGMASQGPPSMPGFAPMQAMPQASSPVAPVRRVNRRIFLWVSAILVVVLIVAGIGSWIVLSQPFTAAPITNPLLSLQDSTMGLSVSYPNDWIQKVDHKNSIIRLYDSSYTDQVDIQAVDAANRNVAEYLQQQEKQLSMTGAKSGATLVFAGGSWQQVSGNVVVDGTNDTTTLLATIHGNRFYTITQYAPQITYADEDTITFSPMRSSFKFLP